MLLAAINLISRLAMLLLVSTCAAAASAAVAAAAITAAGGAPIMASAAVAIPLHPAWLPQFWLQYPAACIQE
jgi:hypothetical protein